MGKYESFQIYSIENINETLDATSRRGRNTEPPPKYQEALNMPKLVRSNVQIVQIHMNDDVSSSQPQIVEECNEVPPTYEDAVQKSKETD